MPFSLFKYLVTLSLMLATVSAAPSLAHAQSAGLGEVTDFLNNYTVGATAEHTVTFKLPVGASPIRTTDYIQVYLPAFTHITPPTSVTGPYGVGPPVFSVSGHYARITGITLIPGNTLKIYGITATNPQLTSMYYFSVLITQDAAGTIVKNSGYGYAQETTAYFRHIAVSAYIDTPQAKLEIEGYAGPDTYITFTEADAVMGTDLSGPDGHFGHLFTGLNPGDHQFTFYGTDPSRLTTTPIIVNIYLPAFQQTSVTDQLLSPTIMLNKAGYYIGENIVASGTALPNGSITLFTEAPLRTYSTTAAANGTWTYTITNTDQYVLGDYFIHALVQDGIGATSLNSPSVGFSMLYSGSPIGTACGDIEHGDLNCDLLIDLTDFSIMMYYWGTNSAVADINIDHYVNLTDFSIMMYYWGTS